jgi:hypothetical protein
MNVAATIGGKLVADWTFFGPSQPVYSKVLHRC